MSKLHAVPVELRECQNFINDLHRHHAAAVRDKFRVGVADESGKLLGVAQVGRPLSRFMADGKTLEVIRLCSDGSKDVCSFLYSRCARIAKEMGYEKIITYILETEPGISLKASGWHCELSVCGGATWENNTRAKERNKRPQQQSMFQDKQKYPVGVNKQRWFKNLKEG